MSPRPARPWFRLYVEAFSDRKLRRLTPTQRWIWVAVLGAARQSPKPGVLLICDGEPWTAQELAEFAAVKERDVWPALEAMKRYGMVTWDDDGVISVPAWDARQFESDDVTVRTAKHRSKERSNVVPRNVRRNAPDTETEAETERDTKSAPAEPPRKQERDALFSALVDVFGPATSPQRKTHYGKTVTTLLQMRASPDQVRARGKVLLAKDWDNPSPEALLKWWDTLEREKPRGEFKTRERDGKRERFMPGTGWVPAL